MSEKLPNKDELYDWLIWSADNSEQAEKYYPELVEAIRAYFQNNAKPFTAAKVLLDVPKMFNQWKINSQDLFGLSRKKQIASYISILNKLLNEYHYEHEIVRKAFDDVREELEEQLNYWQKEHDNCLSESTEVFQFTNNFDHVQESEVYDYFHGSLVLTKYLDKDSLEEFLTLAFDKKTNPEEKFVFKGSPGKNRIRPIFYKYFNEIAHPDKGRKIDYVNLLGNYFKGYNSASLMSNFSK